MREKALSAYRRGKQEVAAWASYWINHHNLLNSGSSIEGRMADYGHVIRSAFSPNEYHKVDEAVARTPWYVSKTHRIIMAHKSRELCLAWYFGTPELLASDFPEITPGREPNKLKALYEKVGRAFNRR